MYIFRYTYIYICKDIICIHSICAQLHGVKKWFHVLFSTEAIFQEKKAIG